VNRIQQSVLEVKGRRHVVDETRDGRELRRAILSLPDTEETNEEVLREARVKHLADQEDVGRKGGLQHNRHVRGVEQADRIRAASTTLARGLDRDLDAETLEVNNGGENNQSSEQIHDVGEVLPVESLLESALLVGPGHQEVEESNDGTLILGATAGIDRGRREGLPHDGLADVGSNEKRNTATKTVTLLEELVEENDDHTGDNQLKDEEEDDTSAELARGAVKTSEDIDSGGTDREDEGEKLLSGLVELAIRLEVEVDVNHVGARKELEDHA